MILIVLKRKNLASNPPVYFAACSVLILWAMLFGPLTWDHYLLYVFPLWGWLLWEISSDRVNRVFGIAAIVLGLMSTPAYPPFWLPSHGIHI